MSADVAVPLVLLCTLAAWIWVWVVGTARWYVRARNRFIAHLFGALLGLIAALGAFFLSASSLMPDTDDRVSGTMGGAFVLLFTCLSVWRTTAEEPAGADPMAAPLASETTSAVSNAPRKMPTQSVRQWWQEETRKQQKWWQEEKERWRKETSKQQELLQRAEQEREQRRAKYAKALEESRKHAEQKRDAWKKVLGMPLGEFFERRFSDHMTFWCVVLFFGVWYSLAVIDPPIAEGWLMRLFVSFIITSLLAFALNISCILIVPDILMFLVLLFPALLTFALEILWRIRKHRPYISSFDHISFSDFPDRVRIGWFGLAILWLCIDGIRKHR
jgi:hypothetical protein